MSFSFRPATREGVGLIIGLAGGTGSGKTYSAMRLAAGIAGDKPFAVIDTESGRAKHYADQFRFDHGDLTAPFTPDRYREAIEAADAAGYPVVVVDSASHEHAGEGGLLDWHEQLVEKFSGGDDGKRERNNMRAWIEPKMAHKRFVARLLQLRAHLVLCFRAEEKVEVARNAQGKMEIRPMQKLTGRDGWIPVCEKTLPYECTVSLLMTASAPGVPLPIKLQEQHRSMFSSDRAIDESAGRAIAEWAGGTKQTKINDEQYNDLCELVARAGLTVEVAAKTLGIAKLDDLPASKYDSVRQRLLAKIGPQ